MDFNKYYYTDRFIDSMDNYEDSNIVILGAPMDYTVSYKAGSREGAQSVRNASWAMEKYSPRLNRELDELKYFDAGDLVLNMGNPEHSIDIIENAIDEILNDNKIPFTFGGEHLITYPIIKSFKKKYEDLILIHLDAHADLRESFFNEELSHATVMRHCSRLVGPSNLFQVGIRSGPKEEFEFGNKYTNFYPFRLEGAIDKINEVAKERPVYISLDIDVLDPAFAPGTGTLEPNGVTSRELFDFFYNLDLKNVVGIDVVEISPYHDVSRMTSVMGANLFRELALKFF